MKMVFIALLVILLLSACSEAAPTTIYLVGPPATRDPAEGQATRTALSRPGALPDLGPAPELNNTVWLNTDAPLTLAGLRGQVVLLDMWTFR